MKILLNSTGTQSVLFWSYLMTRDDQIGIGALRIKDASPWRMRGDGDPGREPRGPPLMAPSVLLVRHVLEALEASSAAGLRGRVLVLAAGGPPRVVPVFTVMPMMVPAATAAALVVAMVVSAVVTVVPPTVGGGRGHLNILQTQSLRKEDVIEWESLRCLFLLHTCMESRSVSSVVIDLFGLLLLPPPPPPPEAAGSYPAPAAEEDMPAFLLIPTVEG